MRRLRTLLSVCIMMAATLFMCEKSSPSEPAPVPAGPASISASITPQSDPFVILSWPPDSNASSYIIERDTNGIGIFSKVATSTDTTYLDTAVIAGKMLHYRVRAIINNQTSSPSPPDSAETPLYCILNPRSGQTYSIGDTVTIRISAAEGRTAGMDFTLDEWLTPISLKAIGFSNTFNPSTTPVVRFVVLPYYTVATSPTTADTFYTAQKKMQIRLYDYGRPSEALAFSQGYFSITGGSTIVDRRQIKISNARSQIIANTRLDLKKGHTAPQVTGISNASRYTLQGKATPAQ